MAEAIKTAVCGALGRMGRQVLEALLTRPGLTLSGAVERREHESLGRDIGSLIGQGPLGAPLVDSLAQVDPETRLYIDFTSPEASLANLEAATDRAMAAVIGTTGFTPEQQARLRQASQKIPLLWAPNMSLGVSVMYKIAAKMAEMLGEDYDLEIIESHHNLKKDAPSGTAVNLYQTLAHTRGAQTGRPMSLVAGRQGQVGARTKDEIGVLALRGGDIIGDHTVYFCGPGERLELTHRAQTRNLFAQGAVRAALWLAGRRPGLYTIDDIIGG